VAIRVSNSEFADERPVTITLPLYSLTTTLPETVCCV